MSKSMHCQSGDLRKGVEMTIVTQADAKWAEKYGPWALVTGASDGIGREMARDLAARGLNVVLVARRRDVLAKIAGEIEQAFKVKTLVCEVDLGEPHSVSRLIEQTKDIDIGLLAACAGFGTAGRFLDIDLETELNMIDVNCRAVFALTRVFAGRFAGRGRGGIVLMSSLAAFQGVPNAANYAATKAYFQTLAEGLHTDLAAHNIDIVVAAPGPVGTGFAARANMKMGKVAQPDMIARETLDALGQKTTLRFGLHVKLLFSTLPRWARTVFMGNIFAGMTKHLSEGKS